MASTKRFELRLPAKGRRRVDRAAALVGLPPATFARTALLRETDRILAAESPVSLSRSESRRFLAALGRPFSPNPALRKALAKGEALGPG